MNYAPSSADDQRDVIGIAFFISIAIATIACGTAEQRSPADATLTETAYENAYFGFTLPLPPGWTVATLQTQEHLRKVGSKALAGDDPLLQAGVEASLPKTFQLLTVSEHPIGAAVTSNPMLIVMAENIAHAPGVKTGADYLFHLAAVFEKSRLPYEAIGDASPIELGGRSFHRRDFAISPPSGVTQSYIFTREGDYALGLILTAQNQPDLEELLGFVSKISFD